MYFYISILLISTTVGASKRCGRSYHIPSIPQCLAESQSIKGGQSSALGSWPWMVKLRVTYRNNVDFDTDEAGPSQPKIPKATKTDVCGGTIIDKNYVLTVAHCIPDHTELVDIQLKAGDVGKDMKSGTLRKVVEKIPHPKYPNQRVGHDLMLLKVDHPFEFSSQTHVNQICLPGPIEQVEKKTECYVMGWGRTNGCDRTKADTLQELCLKYVKKSSCLELKGLSSRLQASYKKQNIFCGTHKNKECECGSGDSGGPMVCKIGDSYKLFGVISRSVIGCQINVFADVRKSLDWIDSIIKRK